VELILVATVATSVVAKVISNIAVLGWSLFYAVVL